MERLPQYARIGTALIVLLIAAVIAEGVTIAQINTRLVRVQHTAAVPGPEGPAGPPGPTGPAGRPGADGLNGTDGQAAPVAATFDSCRFTQQVKVVTDVHRSYYPNVDGTYDIVADKSYINVCGP